MIHTQSFSLSHISQVLCIAQAIVDVACTATEEDLQSVGIKKGAYQKIEFDYLQSLLKRFAHREFGILPGGSTANSLDIISSTGIKSSLLTGYGDDDFGRKFTEAYKRSGVTLINMGHPNIHTGTSFILITPDGERSMSTYLGASEALQPGMLDSINIEHNTLLLIEGYILRGGLGPETGARIKSIGKYIREKNGALILALPPVQVIHTIRNEIRGILESFDILHGNLEEYFELFKVSTLGEVEDALRQNHVRAVITDGARGAHAVVHQRTAHSKALDTEVVDLTGAGDAFLAGWLSGALQGLSVEAALLRGSTFSAKVISQHGARLPHAEIRSLLEEK